jgi:hypothetical protein
MHVRLEETMMRLFTSAILFLLTLSVAAIAQTSETKPAPLMNQDVVSMLKAGLPADVVVAKIKTSSCHFDTSPTALEKLKADGVPGDVMLAMVKASDNGKAPSPSVSNPSAVSKPVNAGPHKARVYISDSQSWLMSGGFGAANGAAGGAVRGGSSPQTVELIKTFGQRCQDVTVTEDKTRADYVILFDRESFKGVLRRRDKIAVFRRNGDVLYSNSVRSVGNAVKDSCQAITKGSGAK